MRICILDQAEQDLIEAFNFYEQQAPGLGDYYLDSVFADLDSLLVYAEIHSIHFGFYRLLTKRFPFAVYYKVVQQEVRIYAILDCRRNPAWTRRRLTS